MAAACAGGFTAPPRRYRMDYLKFVEHHRATNADITIGCLPVDYERASDFGLMKVNDEGEIVVRAVHHTQSWPQVVGVPTSSRECNHHFRLSPRGC